MSAKPLTSAAVFVDTAVLMYAGGRPHPLRDPSRAILEHVEVGRLVAVTSAEVVQEILHRFTAIGDATTATRMAGAALDLFAPVVAITHDIAARARDLVSTHPTVSSRDLVHAATCFAEGIDVVVSPDRDFDEIEGIDRIDPAEPDTLAVHLR